LQLFLHGIRALVGVELELALEQSLELLVPQLDVGVTKSLVYQDPFRKDLKYLVQITLEDLGMPFL